MADPTSIPVILTAILFSLTGCASFASEQPRVTVSAEVVRDLPATHVWLHPGILKDGDLVLPHSKEGYVGIGFYDLAPTERRPDRLKQLRVQGVYYEPWKVGFGQSKWWIWTSDRNWLVLGPDLEKLESKIDGRFTYPVTAPVILGDRAVVYGSGHPEVCRSGTAYFFELDEQGGCVPLLEFNEEETPRNAGMQWLGMAGGLGRAPSGGFAFVDPLRYRVMVFDGKARLE